MFCIDGLTSLADSQFETALRRTLSKSANPACDNPALRRARRTRSCMFTRRLECQHNWQPLKLAPLCTKKLSCVLDRQPLIELHGRTPAILA